MTIEQICNTIEKFFSKINIPVPQIPSILRWCAGISKPGLSNILSISNVVRDLSKIGIPTGYMPDGSPNLTVAFTCAMINEDTRRNVEDLSIQCAIGQGSVQFSGIATTIGGPAPVTGVNVSGGLINGQCL